MIKTSAHIRIDLLGGTLDLRPINIILKNVVTLNAALAIEASVSFEKTNNPHVVLDSLDYKKQISLSASDIKNSKAGNSFGLIVDILNYFQIRSGVHITLQSNSPPGAGLGGSSAMGVALYKALCSFTGQPFHPNHAISVLNAIEGRLLDSGPAGYQDYYPPIYGGVLALRPVFNQVQVVQLFSNELKNFLEERLSLICSGQLRLSGTNNWEVYKGFFDKDPVIRNKLQNIADLSYRAFQAIEKGEYDKLIEFIQEEGRVRKDIFPNIVSSEVQSFWNECQKDFPEIGLKVCGAGGGGCFLLIHKKEDRNIIRDRVNKNSSMKLMNLSLCPPLLQDDL